MDTGCCTPQEVGSGPFPPHPLRGFLTGFWGHLEAASQVQNSSAHISNIFDISWGENFSVSAVHFFLAMPLFIGRHGWTPLDNKGVLPTPLPPPSLTTPLWRAPRPSLGVAWAPARTMVCAIRLATPLVRCGGSGWTVGSPSNGPCAWSAARRYPSRWKRTQRRR